MTVRLDPRVGTMTGSRPVLEAFLDGVRDGWSSVPRDQRTALRVAGAIDADGRASRPLRRIEGTVRDRVTPSLVLSGAGRRVIGRVGRTVSVLLTVADDEGLSTLLPVHTTLVPKAVARAVGLRPAPTPQDPRNWSDLIEDAGTTRVWTLAIGDPTACGWSLTVAATTRGYYDVVGDIARPSTPGATYRAVAAGVGACRPNGG